MSARFDHAADAERLLAVADNKSVPSPAVIVAMAQVRAALALVEQQRIANLIAASQMEGGPYRDVNRWSNGEEDAVMVIRREVREGLGL